MARIRTIKPEFWASEVLGTKLRGPDGRQARLLFIALWNHAEDHGVARGAPALVRSVAFPYDEDVTAADVARWLGMLEAAGLVVRYERNGSAYVWVRGFAEHQRIDRPSKTTLPEPSHEERGACASPRAVPSSPACETTTPVASPRRALDEPSLLEGKGREGKGEDLFPKAPRGAGDSGKHPAPVAPVHDAAGRLPFEAPEERHDPAAWTVADACDAVHRVVMGHGYAWDMRADELAATALMSLCAADKVPMSQVPEEIGRRFGRALVRMRDRFSTGKAATLKMLAVRECWRINATCPEVEEEGRGPDGIARRTRRQVEPWVDVLAEREAA